MELVNFIGVNPSKDGKWLLVTFARKGSDDKLRWIVPFCGNVPHYANGALPFACKEDDRYKLSLALTSYKKKEEPKEEHEQNEDEIPF